MTAGASLLFQTTTHAHFSAFPPTTPTLSSCVDRHRTRCKQRELTYLKRANKSVLQRFRAGISVARKHFCLVCQLLSAAPHHHERVQRVTTSLVVLVGCDTASHFPILPHHDYTVAAPGGQPICLRQREENNIHDGIILTCMWTLFFASSLPLLVSDPMIASPPPLHTHEYVEHPTGAEASMMQSNLGAKKLLQRKHEENIEENCLIFDVTANNYARRRQWQCQACGKVLV